MIRLYRVSGREREKERESEGMQMFSLNKVQMRKEAGREDAGKASLSRGAFLLEQGFKNYFLRVSG